MKDDLSTIFIETSWNQYLYLYLSVYIDNHMYTWIWHWSQRYISVLELNPYNDSFFMFIISHHEQVRNGFLEQIGSFSKFTSLNFHTVSM